MRRVHRSSVSGIAIVLAALIGVASGADASLAAHDATAATRAAALSDAVNWLGQEAHRLIRGAGRTMNSGRAAFPPQVGTGYEAFWLRDYAYTLEGSVDSYSDEELTDACRLFVGSLRSDGAGVDCVKFDGTPIYQPGYGTMGVNPVADGSQFTVAVAWHTYQKTKDRKLLDEVVEPLIRAMNAVPRNPDTHLVHIQAGEAWDRCAYGFTDTVRKQGDELFCSLLYVQASRQLADLLEAQGRTEDARNWRDTAEIVAASIRNVFWDDEVGLFRAATRCCREHDIWGSAFSVYLAVADPDQSRAVATYFQTHYAEIVQHGQIRHLPGGVYWEQAGARQLSERRVLGYAHRMVCMRIGSGRSPAGRPDRVGSGCRFPTGWRLRVDSGRSPPVAQLRGECISAAGRHSCPAGAQESSAQQPIKFFPDVANELSFPPQDARFVRLVIAATAGGQPCIDELEVYGEGSEENLALMPGATASASSCLKGYTIHRIEHLNDGRYGNSHSWIAAGQVNEWAQIELPKPATVRKVVFSRSRRSVSRSALAHRRSATVTGWRELADGLSGRRHRAAATAICRVRPAGDPASKSDVGNAAAICVSLRARYVASHER